MRRRRQPGYLVVALVAGLVAFVALAAFASGARAYHDEEQRLISDTAYTLDEDQWRLGLFRLDYGLSDDFTGGTYLLPWVIAMANVQVKYEFWQPSEDWVLAVRGGLFRLDLSVFQRLDVDKDSSAIFWIAPLEGVVSWRIDDTFTLNGQLVYTAVGVVGNYNADEFEGAAAVTNGQLALGLEWRLTRVTALILHGRSLLFQLAQANASSTSMPDEYTTIEVRGTARSEVFNVEDGSSLTASVAFSWETFNLRLGLGYGNWSLPAINFVLPTRTPIADFDLFWRW